MRHEFAVAERESSIHMPTLTLVAFRFVLEFATFARIRLSVSIINTAERDDRLRHLNSYFDLFINRALPPSPCSAHTTPQSAVGLSSACMPFARQARLCDVLNIANDTRLRMPRSC